MRLRLAETPIPVSERPNCVTRLASWSEDELLGGSRRPSCARRLWVWIVPARRVRFCCGTWQRSAA
jgi:hypothetical protein